jgi:hypothetical protein
MDDFSNIISLNSAEKACRDGRLVKTLLLPAEIGGLERPENVIFIPPHALLIKNQSTTELLSAIRMGMIEVAVTPEYRAASVVPTKILISASLPKEKAGYSIDIGIW